MDNMQPCASHCDDLCWMQIDSSFASWRDCFSVAWVSGETGHGLGRVLKRVTQLIPKWSITLGSKELNSWRRKMAVALTGAATATQLSYDQRVSVLSPSSIDQKAARKQLNGSKSGQETCGPASPACSTKIHMGRRYHRLGVTSRVCHSESASPREH